MSEQETKQDAPKKKAIAKQEVKSSVKSYQQGIETEKQKMSQYSKRFGTTVRSLQNDFKKHQKEMQESASQMREEGIKNMSGKIEKFKSEIKAQIKENKDAVAPIANGVKFLVGECNKKKRDFKVYAKGTFSDYIKAFWG